MGLMTPGPGYPHVNVMFGLLMSLLTLVGSGRSSQLRVGGAVNLFGRFGYLSISMRVVPRNDSDNTWIFREPIVDIFKTDQLRTVSWPVEKKPDKAVFHGDFNMEFCDDMPQLLQAYFRDFTVENLDKPWQAFTGSWTPAMTARNLGLNISYVSSGHCYVLIRLSRVRESAKLSDDFDPSKAHLQHPVAKQASLVDVKNFASVGNFIRNFGSHYVTSYVTGNSLYQVLVYSPKVYNQLKARLQDSGLSSLGHAEMITLFSPWYAEHLGLVLPASGNATLARWAKSALSITSYIFTYTSLLKLRSNSSLLRELDTLLGNEAVLQLHLKTLGPIFKDQKKRDWFVEVLDNNLKLWEVNMFA
ncbi:torso-like protein [Nesidiocoris tenuis]|uniref:Torso-like protein n=1 Tax=Nesidiocoris tenuis TaxID=355587 RepID=A0ABN7AFS6_9HEMI|nr:torso-like protein [Nesidiocoris tenuis]